MSDLGQSIVLGVVSGVLTATILFIISRFISDTLLPLYRAKMYSSTDLSGTWYLERNDVPADGEALSVSPKLEANLIQHADILKGSATSSHPDTGVATNYKVQGVIRDRFVTLSLHITDNKRIACQNFLLEVVGDGQTMDGYNYFYGLYKKKIRSIKCKFVRSN